MAILWLAGGASRADVLGQAIVRLACWLCLIVMVLFSRRPVSRDVRPIAWLLAGAVLLTLVQLIPLPPSIWSSLPGRAPLLEAAAAAGQSQPWRPWSIVPAMTFNAASSLIVPITALILVGSLTERERGLLIGLVLILIAASMFLGLLQFSGAGLANPLINDSANQVSSNFANRNHFALFLAFGCLLVPVWAFDTAGRSIWRAAIAIGLMALSLLAILTSGSRAGLIFAVLAVVIGLALARGGLSKLLHRYPGWVSKAVAGGAIIIIGLVALLSAVSGRVGSISRALAGGVEDDLRVRTFPAVWSMVQTYFPAGSGLGTFDPVYRRHEPLALLDLTYLNHAHNDMLEIILDAGIFGLALLVAAMAWWLWASIKAWRPSPSYNKNLSRLGSATLLLVMIASIFDYPARTPMMMAIIIIAAFWLNTPPVQRDVRRGSTLPSLSQRL